VNRTRSVSRCQVDQTSAFPSEQIRLEDTQVHHASNGVYGTRFFVRLGLPAGSHGEITHSITEDP